MIENKGWWHDLRKVKNNQVQDSTVEMLLATLGHAASELALGAGPGAGGERTFRSCKV